jgi:arabinofuranosyltransferase
MHVWRYDIDLVWRGRLSVLACLAISMALLGHAFAYNFLCDDAYISFRYVQNALLGRGLVFNPGDPVEGYTNFLWVVQLCLLGRAGLGPEDGSLALSLVYTIGTVWLVVLLVRETTFRRHWWLTAPLALLLLAANRSFAVWTTSGLETRCNTFFIMLGTLGVARLVRGGRGHVIAAIGWSGACLTRPDSLLLFALSALFLLLARGGVRRTLGYALPTLAVVLMHSLWRRWYYGDWFPNTFYAKVGESWWDMGMSYLGSVVIEYTMWLTVGLAIWGALRARKRGAGVVLGFLLAAMAAQSLYLARLGGDHFEYRPFDFFWPALAVAASASLAQSACRTAPRWRTAVCAAVIGILLLYGNAIPTLSFFAERGIRTRQEATLCAVRLRPEQAGPLGRLPGMPAFVRLWNGLTERTIAHGVGVRHFEHRINTEFLLAHYVPFKGLREAGLIPADAVAKAGAVGIIAFYTDIPIVDLFGLTDRTIARARQRQTAFRIMAHEREPPPGYIESRGVNFESFFLSSVLAERDGDLADRFVVAMRDDLFLYFKTAQPQWARKAFAGRIVRGPR